MVIFLFFAPLILLVVWALLRSHEMPVGLLLFNLVPIAIAPVLLFMSIFFFDAPGHGAEPYLAFSVVNGYPYLIVGAMFLSNRLWRQGRRRWAWVPPAVFHAVNIGYLLYVFLS